LSGKAAPPSPIGFVGEYDNHSVTLSSRVRIGYHEEGRIEDPTLILLHGLNGHSGTWRKNIAFLGKKHRVLTISLPTHHGGIESLPTSMCPMWRSS
jgi:pimeloyl-ACP methyl ester carboxylesterase